MKAHTSFITQLGRIGLFLAVSLVASQAFTPLVAAPETNGTSVKATMFGHFDYGIMGWTGNILIKFGDGPVKVGQFTPVTGEVHLKGNGAPYGTETCLIILDDGTFEMACSFEASFAHTPGLLDLHEVGTIQNGTDAYEGISGNVSIKGPYLNPMPPMIPLQPLYIGEVTGSVRGPHADCPH